MSDLWLRVIAYGGIASLIVAALLVWCCCRAASDADDRLVDVHDGEPNGW